MPLIIGGFIAKGQDKHFRGLRNDYLPGFNRHLDDYTQYLPAAVLLGLKLGGEKSRSSWKRMLASDLFATTIMAGIVNSLKYTTHVERPDGSNRTHCNRLHDGYYADQRIWQQKSVDR